ncbi:MAG: TonB-dependent receptor domain-containing protein [Cyclobacteriaceae bacterium]
MNFAFRSSIATLFAILFLQTSLLAQSTIKGSVIDAETGKALPFGNVALLQKSDSTIAGGSMTNENGAFSFEAPQGNYLLRVTFIGYNEFFKNIEVSKSTVNLSKIRLSSSSEQLDEVTIEAAGITFETDIDKRTFDVENSILAEGGTAIELLETLPSVQVDEEGNIAMRGSGDILIYINGRPTNLMSEDAESVLEQFPANAISKVELITNPSSRYDAAGVGGIINIVLKENSMVGFNGSVNTSIGTRNKYNAGVNLNYSTEKWDFFTAYNYQYRQTWGLGDTYRQNKNPGVTPIIDQEINSMQYRPSHLMRVGADYSLNKKSTIGAFFNINRRDSERDQTYDIRHLNNAQSLDSMFIRDRNQDSRSINYEGGINFNKDIDTLGQKIFANFTYSIDDRSSFETYDQFYFDNQMIEDPSKDFFQNNERTSTNEQLIAQIDYEKPITETLKLELGARSMLSSRLRTQNFNDFNVETNEFETNEIFTNDFSFDEHIHAAYFLVRNQWDKLGVQAGLRSEYTRTNSFQTQTQEEYINNYLDFFPSIYFSYDLTEKTSLLVNYSRRINRPGIWSLSPAISARDIYNLRTGNPFLNPEYTNSFELSFLKEWKKLTITSSAYYRMTTDVMTRVIEPYDDNTVISTWANANSRRTAGLEFINQYTPNSWLDATFTANLFHSEIIGSNIGEGFNNANNSWSLNLMTNARIPDWFTVQMQGFYRGPIVLPQGFIEPMFSMNIGLRRDILNNKGTVSLNVSDLFNTRIFVLTTEAATFTQERTFNRESQIATLTFVYRFGGYKDGRENGRGRGDDDSDDLF